MLLDFSDRTRPGIFKLISHCAHWINDVFIPYILIFQACRGDETDRGQIDLTQVRSPSSSPSKGPEKRKRTHGTDKDTIPFSKYRFGEVYKARPTWEDMIIAYSTIPGFASIRDHDHGTWFIQSLVEVFMNHAFDKELIDLLRMTSERLSHFTNEQGEKQTCNIEMRHLYKRIYFNPGLPQSIQGSPKLLRRCQSTPPASPRRTLDDDEWNLDQFHQTWTFIDLKKIKLYILKAKSVK